MRRLLPLVLVAAAAGCGGSQRAAPPPPPKLPRAVASDLAARSDRVAADLARGDTCAARADARALQAATITDINAHRVPAAFQEHLQSAANSLAARITCTPPPAPREDHGKHKGHDKHGGEGD